MYLLALATWWSLQTLSRVTDGCGRQTAAEELSLFSIPVVMESVG